jgi:hypothetical protein
MAGLNAALAAVQAAVTAAGRLQGASIATVAPVAAAAANALPVVAAAVAALDGSIDTTTVGGVVAGIPTPVMVQTLLRAASDVQQLAKLVYLQGYIGRLATNVAQAPG